MSQASECWERNKCDLLCSTALATRGLWERLGSPERCGLVMQSIKSPEGQTDLAQPRTSKLSLSQGPAKADAVDKGLQQAQAALGNHNPKIPLEPGTPGCE